MQVKTKPPAALPWDECAADIEKLVGQLKSMKEARKFDPFIDFMQFPKFRNLRPGTRVSCEFPLTALVGRNGTGKSAVLLAFRGAPGGASLGQWWFGTPVDPIDEDEAAAGTGRKRQSLEGGDRSAFWYGYREAGTHREVLKTRIRREGDPDYWEPSRPVRKYGMALLDGDQRHPTIQKPVVYLNFKIQVNAFDRCFYYFSKASLDALAKTKFWERIATKKPRAVRVQDFLRQRSADLKEALEGVRKFRSRIRPRVRSVTKLTPEELLHVARILGRDYTAGTIIEHRLYETWGKTVYFETTQRSYTDAYAGSGEAAVVNLVHSVCEAQAGTLLLLDEPETSLHPGAQRELVRFLLTQCRDKRLQIVLSTHSPTVIEQLPAGAIRVCTIGPDGLVDIDGGRPAQEAFYEIGMAAPNVKTVVVEDALAMKVAQEVLNTLPGHRGQLLRLRFHPGGESGMSQSMAVYMHSQEKPVFIFDGDRDLGPLPDWRTLSAGDVSATRLGQMIRDRFGKAVPHQDSNMPEVSKVELQKAFLDYAMKHVLYFPFSTPEELLWSDETCTGLVATCNPDADATAVSTRIAAEKDAKSKFAKLALELGMSDVAALHDMFIRRFRSREDDRWKKTYQLLDELAKGASNA